MLLKIAQTSKDLTKYVGVVSIGFIVDFVIFLALVDKGASTLVANTSAFAVGMTINVLLIRYFVFPGTPVPRMVDFMATLSINVLVMLIGTWIIWFLSHQFDLLIAYSKLIANCFTLILNYAGRTLLDRYWKCSQNYRNEP